MSPTPETCPKCAHSMQQGFITDFGHSGVLPSTWVPGSPQRSFWTGTKLPPREEWVPVAVFRCTGCGYLESYARPEFGTEES